ncbi:LPS export ABC transporter permease LptF [Rhodosalinus halophilus]|uniref:LPS export ABC transporter permease LptF n=1 Tax=Rhodosalinus halophilus TaxID=2259333 RepID=UPI001F00FBA0|nr:LPS export ABC transporter permease LptF [Rhodosalinus halophilus]
MARFDRYLIGQLMVLFGFFALVLVGVYWVNRAVVLFDQLLADGHSAMVFLEFTMLALPKVIAMVLPMAAFAATVYVVNRLASESELTVMQATGFSPWRIARPVLIFGLIVAAMMAMLTNVLLPAASAELEKRESEISTSVSARLLRDGVFLNPARGVTFFIREITPEGELRDVYLSDRRREGRPVTYTAERAFLLRDGERTQLVMVDGLAQTLDADDQRLSVTNFEEFAYDVSRLIEAARPPRDRPAHLSTADLLLSPDDAMARTGYSRARVLEEGHMRLQQPLLAVVAALVGAATLLAGGFNRLGLGPQVALAVLLLVAVKMVEGALGNLVRTEAWAWPLIYLPSAMGLAMAGGLLWFAARPRRPRGARPAPEAAA